VRNAAVSGQQIRNQPAARELLQSGGVAESAVIKLGKSVPEEQKTWGTGL